MCKVAYCNNPPGGGRSSRHWTLCNTHRHRERRHGDVLQKGILGADLKPYLRNLDKRQNVSPNAKLWGMLAARWGTLIGRCNGILTVRSIGTPTDRWESQAAAELVRVAEQTTAQTAWRTAVAMFLLREYEPRRFVSDRAFLVQLGRRVRHLAEANSGSFWDPVTGRTKFAYRDPNPRVAVLIGQWLAETFGVAGVHFAEQDREEAEQRDAERRAFHGALREVTATGETTAP
jgi:hypothetical protein